MYKMMGADGKEYGPFSTEQLRQWIAEGRANAQTHVLLEGAGEWKPLASFPEFAAALNSRPAAPLTPGPAAISAVPKTNPLAVTGLILGIVSITVACCCYGFPFNLAGIIFSAIALSQIKKDPAGQQGRGLAIAGLALSILSIIFGALFLILGFAMNSSDILRKIENL